MFFSFCYLYKIYLKYLSIECTQIFPLNLHKNFPFDEKFELKNYAE